MDENEFRTLYQQINQQRCVFEKALVNRRCDCQLKQTFLLANREGVACQSTVSLARCTEFLNTLRAASRFALHALSIDGSLPHNKELKVQAGGCIALQQHLFPEKPVHLVDIDSLLNLALLQYADLAELPYSELVRGVVHYISRPSARRF